MIAHSGSLDAAALYRRLTIRLLPFLVLCYVVSVIDRLNIAMAKLQMLPALGFSEAVYGLGAGVFFLGYLIFDVPSNLIMQRVGARWWIGRIMISWGIVSVATAFVHTTFWFYVARFLLGAAEAGFFAGLLMYLTYWFPASQRGRAYSILLLAAPLAGVVGNPVAGWIMTQFNGSAGLGGWQWLFVAEGLPAVVLGVMSLRVLSTGPDNAGWLTPGERAMIRARLDADEAVKPPGKALGFLTSPLVWLMCAICFGISAGMYAVGFWLPTLIHATGVQSAAVIGLYAAIPWLVAMAPLVVGGRLVDRSGERRWWVAAPLLVCAAALALSTATTGLAPALVALTIATGGVLTSLGLFWNLPATVLSGYGAAGGLALINSVGSLAGFFTPWFIGIVKDATGSTAGGMLGVACVIALGGVLTLLIPRRLVDGAAQPGVLTGSVPELADGAVR